jgi:putative membrane protein
MDPVGLLILLCACLLGVVVGLLTGIIPGLHVNLIVFMILGWNGVDGALPPEPVTIFVVALALTQVFMSFVPAVFLRAPCGDTAVAVFPGDRMLQRGLGPSAVVAAQTGAFAATCLAVVVAFAAMLLAPRLLPGLEAAIKPMLGPVLLAILIFFMARDLDWQALWGGRIGLFMWHASGVLLAFALLAQLSEVALSGALCSPEQGIMAAFSGMFGVATLIPAVLSKQSDDLALAVPQQPAERVGLRAACVPSIMGALGGTLVGLLPAVGTAEMSAVLCGVPDRLLPSPTRKLDADRRYLMTVGAVAAADAVLAIAAIFLIGKSRSGASIGVEQLLGDRIASSTEGETLKLFGRLLAFGFVASMLAFRLGVRAADHAGALYTRVQPRALARATVVALAMFCILTAGLVGLTVFIAAAAIGLIFLHLRIRAASLMAFLLVPAASFFLGARIPGLPLLPVEQVAAHTMPAGESMLYALASAIGAGAAVYWLHGRRRGG